MAHVALHIADLGDLLGCRRLHAREALGEPTVIEIEAVSAEPVAISDVLGKACAVVLGTEHGERTIHGIVARFAAIATSQAAPSRRYALTVRSAIHRLDLCQRTRVFQHLSVPEIVQQVLDRAGHGGERFVAALAAPHPTREYVVQYAESDLGFVRRMCEEEGLYHRLEARDGFDAFVLEDTSPTAPAATPAELALVDLTDLSAPEATAWEPRAVRRARAGKVHLRDYDPAHPALDLSSRAEDGLDVERGIEVYVAAAGFKTPAAGDLRARLALERLRADGALVRFRAAAMAIAPGLSVTLENRSGTSGLDPFAGDYFVVSATHAWSTDASRYELELTAIPRAVSFRLASVTPRPRIAGLHSAVVTGPAGQEICADASGRVRVRFFWDREGPTDDSSSLPVRVLQPNLPGSMLIPRVGWEVLVAFEDGDPDRPFVVGRLYNAKQPPPFSLPANKTVTSLATLSSPGAARSNSVHFDDAAGRQHMAWVAGFGKATTVANNMVTQTFGNEGWTIHGAQKVSIGANDKLSVTDPYVVAVGSQSATVGGSQSIKVLGDMGVTTGGETVLIGGMLFEKVGNPVAGLKGLAISAALELVGSNERFGHYAAAAAGIALAAYQGFEADGLAGGVAGLGKSVAELLLPGADAVAAAAEGAGEAPWAPQKEEATKGDVAPGGGAAAPSAATGGAGRGGGQRVTKVDSAMTELIGGPHVLLTPGSVRATTLGQSIVVVGGDHTIRAAKVSNRTLGASSDNAAALDIQAGAFIARNVKAALSRSVGGSWTSSAGKDCRIKAGGALTLSIGGALSAEGGIVVFKCGGSTVSASSGGVLLKATDITINGAALAKGEGTTP